MSQSKHKLLGRGCRTRTGIASRRGPGTSKNFMQVRMHFATHYKKLEQEERASNTVKPVQSILQNLAAIRKVAAKALNKV